MSNSLFSANSAIYQGHVVHQRLQPAEHRLKMALFMLLLDLDELPTVFDHCALWSVGRANVASFWRRDYYQHPDEPDLKQGIQQLVRQRTGLDVPGRVLMLTHLRYFGLCFNPITLYYCYDLAGVLQAIVADVTNTPWQQRYQYILLTQAQGDSKAMQHPSVAVVRSSDTDYFEFELDKQFHVSPCQPMQMRYHWRLSAAQQQLQVRLQSYRPVPSQARPSQNFTASLMLERKHLTTQGLNQMLLQYPLLGARVLSGIYWHAFRLWLKGTPFYKHPKRAEPLE